jgi:hypothetical protein
MQNQGQEHDRGGGAYIGGNVTVGGDFVGRDQYVGRDHSQTTGLQGRDLAELFRNVYQGIDARPPSDSVDHDELKDTVKRIEVEAAKQDDASTQKVSRWLGVLADAAPDVLELVLNALTNPAAAVSSSVKMLAQGFAAR